MADLPFAVSHSTFPPMPPPPPARPGPAASFPPLQTPQPGSNPFGTAGQAGAAESLPEPSDQRRGRNQGSASSQAPAGSLEAMVRQAFENNYSDIHLGVGEEPRFRVRGDMVRSGWPITDAITFRDWLRELLTPAVIDSFQRELEFDGSHDFGFVRVRINLLETLNGPGMVLRLIPHQIADVDQLGLPEVLKDLVSRPKGMLLVTGPTGSGKSTTLAALIEHINKTMKRHIITIEDPIEFVYESKESLIRQREVRQHTRHFKTALRASLREDPDVILIGEIRDQETLSTAIEASQTGHLMLGTLHTNSAVRTVERVIGLYPSQEQDAIRRSLAETLLGVVSQGLVKTNDGKRCAFHDLFVNTDACKDYIMRGDLDEIEEIMGRSGFDGMITTNQSLLKLVESGRVSAEEALGHSLRANELSQALRGRF